MEPENTHVKFLPGLLSTMMATRVFSFLFTCPPCLQHDDDLQYFPL